MSVVTIARNALPANLHAAGQRAKENGIRLRLVQLTRHWVCVVDGELGHVNNTAMLVEAAIAKLQRKDAA